MAVLRPPIIHIKANYSLLDEYVIDLKWSANGNWLAAGSASGEVAVIDFPKNQIVYQKNHHPGGLNCITWHPKTAILSSAGQDGKVKILDLSDGATGSEIKTSQSWVEKVLWNPKGEYFLTAAGKQLQLWDKQYLLAQEWNQSDHMIMDVAWLPKGNSFVAGSHEKLVIHSIPQKDLPSNQSTTISIPFTAKCLAPSWDQKWIAVGCLSEFLFFTRPDGTDQFALKLPSTSVNQVIWMSDNLHILATAGNDLVVVDVKKAYRDQPCYEIIHDEDSPMIAMAIQPRKQLIACANSLGKLGLWTLQKRMIPLLEESIENGISQLSWSPNEQYLAVGTPEGRVIVLAIQ